MSEVIEGAAEEARTSAPAKKQSLRRELTLFGAIAFSIGAMGPTFAVALNGVAPAGLVGRAVPLIFVFAMIGILLVSYSFIKLSGYFATAGSVYSFSGATLGPRAGFVSGWGLFGTYFAFVACLLPAAAAFFVAFLESTGIWSNAPWFPIALAFGLIVWLCAHNDVKIVSRTILSIEFLSVSLILIIVVVIFAKLIGGSAPNDASFSLSVFSLPDGVSFNAVGLATVFGFLSFSGFEGVATIAEETKDPRRTIGKAILGLVLIGGAFYVIGMTAQSMGFGANAAGAEAFASSESPLGELASSYIGEFMGDLINLGVTISALGAAIAVTGAASRMLFSFARDGLGPEAIGTTSEKTGSPSKAVATVIVSALVVIIGLKVLTTGEAFDLYFWLATIGVLSLLVVYMIVTVGAGVFLFVKNRLAPAWQAIIPILALIFLGYTLWKNVSPVPESPANLFPYIAAGWIAIGLLIVVVKADFTRRIGLRFASEADSSLKEKADS